MLSVKFTEIHQLHFKFLQQAVTQRVQKVDQNARDGEQWQNVYSK